MAGEKHLPAAWIGSQAQADLAACREASILGATSQGIYLHINRRRVVFLTTAIQRGPLTLNLPEKTTGLDEVETTGPVEISSGKIIFPGIAVINFDIAPIWTPPLPGEAQDSPTIRGERLKHLTGGLRAIKGTVGFSFLLTLTQNSSATGVWDEEQAALYQQAQAIRAALRLQKMEELPDLLIKFLGQGRGLTPSGDDLVCGALLSLNRWGHILAAGMNFSPANEPVITAAYTQTTSISASLIEMATHGWASERLLHGLDYLMTGKPPLPEAIRSLAGFGSSSGMDALAGMALIVNRLGN
jgi:hypothetical protein